MFYKRLEVISFEKFLGKKACGSMSCEFCRREYGSYCKFANRKAKEYNRIIRDVFSNIKNSCNVDCDMCAYKGLLGCEIAAEIEKWSLPWVY